MLAALCRLFEQRKIATAAFILHAEAAISELRLRILVDSLRQVPEQIYNFRDYSFTFPRCT
jgi:hypothetical protein